MPDFKLSEGATTNPANLPLDGTELIFLTQTVGGVPTTVVIDLSEVMKLGLTEDDLAAISAQIDGKANAIHQHSADAITEGVFSADRIPSLPISKITNLTTQLGGKSNVGHTHQISDVAGLEDALASAGGGGGGGISLPIDIEDVEGLPLALEDLELSVGNKANVVHAHAIADVTGLQDALDNAGGGPEIDDAGAPAADKVWSSSKTSTELAGKAAVSHEHAAGDVTSGTFDVARIPDIAIAKVTGLQDELDGLAGGGGGTIGAPVIANANTTLDSSHLNRIVEHDNSSVYTYTIAPDLGANGDIITFVNNSAVSLNVSRGSGVTLYRYGTNQNVVIPTRRSMTVYRSSVANVWYAL